MLTTLILRNTSLYPQNINSKSFCFQSSGFLSLLQNRSICPPFQTWIHHLTRSLFSLQTWIHNLFQKSLIITHQHHILGVCRYYMDGVNIKVWLAKFDFWNHENNLVDSWKVCDMGRFSFSIKKKRAKRSYRKFH